MQALKRDYWWYTNIQGIKSGVCIKILQEGGATCANWSVFHVKVAKFSNLHDEVTATICLLTWITKKKKEKKEKGKTF